MSIPNIPFGTGYDEVNATNVASTLASLVDQVDSMTRYMIDSYSPYSAEDIAAYWASLATPVLEEPTEAMLDKANKFKSWLATVSAWVDSGMNGDVGYQIKSWRSATPYPPFR